MSEYWKVPVIEEDSYSICWSHENKTHFREKKSELLLVWIHPLLPIHGLSIRCAITQHGKKHNEANAFTLYVNTPGGQTPEDSVWGRCHAHWTSVATRQLVDSDLRPSRPKSVSLTTKPSLYLSIINWTYIKLDFFLCSLIIKRWPAPGDASFHENWLMRWNFSFFYVFIFLTDLHIGWCHTHLSWMW